MDRTLAMGANVAAMRGIAVEANHQPLSMALTFKLLGWCEGLTKDHHRPHLEGASGPSDVYACGGAQVCRLDRLVLGHPVQFLPYPVVHPHGSFFQKGFHRARCHWICC